MRFAAGIVLLLLFLTSCSRYSYQYLQFSSNEPARQSELFIVENDTFRIVYDFRGEDAPVKIAIVNKSKKPIEVDWDKSFLYKDSRSVALSSNKLSRSVPDELKEQTKIPKTEFIMPNASLFRICGTVSKGHFLKNTGFQYKSETIAVGEGNRKIKKANIDIEKSPLLFSISLSLRPAEAPPVTIERAFYVSEIVATTIAPQKLPPHLQSRQAVLQRHTLTGTGLVIAGTAATIVIAVGALYLKGLLDDEEE